MTSERWQAIERLYHAASERPEDSRAAFLAEACAEDAELRREVESLLAHEPHAVGFMSTPAVMAPGAVPGTGESLTGRQLGPYSIHARLGVGGMGEVYKARDTRLDRDVAIKVLTAHIADDPQSRERFQREARAVAALNHPHICTLHDVGSHDGTDFLVMEYLDGETLADRLSRVGSGPSCLPVNEALQHAIQIASALDRAHRAGIVHRDLKPGNIFLVRSGGASAPPTAKLLDFGLAKFRAVSQDGGVMAAMTQPLSGEGMLTGTVPYMAPEQLEGREADARSDLFAFGAVLYEMVTGRRAFEGVSQASIIAAIMERDPPPISTLQPLTPPALDRLVSTCLAKDPDDRWQTARDLLRELKWIAEARPEEAAHETNSRRGWPHALRGAGPAWLGAGVFLAACLIMLSVLWFRAASAPAAAAHLFLPPPAGTKYVSTAVVGGPTSVSPDGRRLAFVAMGDDGVQRLWVHSLDSALAAALPGTERASYPFWSPDSRSLGFFVPGKLKRTDASGGLVQELCDAAVGRGGTWNQDGVIVFSPGPRAAPMRVSDKGGLPAEMPGFLAESNAIYPAFLPDGRHFLFTRSSLSRVQAGIYVSSLDGDRQELLIADSSNAGYSRSGYLLYVKKRTLVAQPFDAKGLRLTGPAIQVADAVAYMDGPRLGNFAVSDTVLAYFGVGSQDRARLELVDRAGTRVSTIGDPDVFNDFRLSPDDRRIAFVRSDAQGTDQIWVLDVRSGTPTPLTEGPIYEGTPVWLDNSRILFSRNGGLGGVAQLAADGAGGIQSVVDQSPVGKASYDAARDGRSILYGLAQDQNQYDLWALPTAGPKAFRVPGVPSDQREVQLSRDGRWLAYVSSESGSARVYVQRFSEQPAEIAPKCPVAIGAQPKWGADGNELFYVAGGNLMVVEIQRGPTCGAGAPKVLFALGADALGPPGMPHRYAVTADGQHFLISRTTKEAVPIPLTVILNWTAGLTK